MSKCRRKRIAKSIDHFKSVETAMATLQGHDVEWLRGQVKAAIRMSKQMEYAMAIYEEDFAADIEAAVRRATCQQSTN